MPGPETPNEPTPQITPDDSAITGFIVNRFIPKQPPRDADPDRLLVLRGIAEGQMETVVVAGREITLKKVFGEPGGEFVRLVNTRGAGSGDPNEAQLVRQKREEFMRIMERLG